MGGESANAGHDERRLLTPSHGNHLRVLAEDVRAERSSPGPGPVEPSVEPYDEGHESFESSATYRVEAGGIEPPSEGSDRRIPEWSGVAKGAESRRWRFRSAPQVTHSFRWTWNVSGTCGQVAHRVRAALPAWRSETIKMHQAGARPLSKPRHSVLCPAHDHHDKHHNDD